MTLWQGLSELSMEDGALYPIPCGSDPLLVVSYAEDLAPGTLVLNYDMLSRCREQLRAALRRIPDLRVTLCGEIEGPAQEELITMGIVGFLRRDVSASEMYNSVKALVNREVWVSRSVTSSALAKLVFQANSKSLSERELEILRSITHGYKNCEIADRLCISRDTVR